VDTTPKQGVQGCDSFTEKPLPYFLLLFDHTMEGTSIDITSFTTKDPKPGDYCSAFVLGTLRTIHFPYTFISLNF